MKTFIKDLFLTKDSYSIFRIVIVSLTIAVLADFFYTNGTRVSGYILMILLCSFVLIDTINTYLNKKLELEKMKYVDLNYFNFNDVKGLDPLDAYIDVCLSSRLILIGYKEGAYITEAQEKDILRELLEEVSSNMGQLMKSKFELIYGVGHVDEVLANKCFIRVSLFVANNNKPRYTNVETDKAQLDKQLIDQMMMK